nr:cytochrome p450 1a5 [Quercus suber]
MLSALPFNISACVGVILVACVLIYRSLLPKPIPGIPYDKKSAARILGDAPDAMKYQAETGEILAYLKLKCKELNSPIIQMFMRPGGKPWVIMTDGREVREFDRSRIFADMLISLYPKTHIIMKTDDEWRWNRRLVADAMSPDFLNNVATHMVYKQTQVLVNLWRQKARLCSGYVVDVQPDVVRCTVDAMFAATFGVGLGTNKSQIEYLSGLDRIDLPKSRDTVVQIPQHGLPSSWSDFQKVFKSSELAISSPLGRTAHWLAVTFSPSLRKSIKIRNQIVQDQVEHAWETFGKGDDSTDIDQVRCIVDLLVAKEAKLARKEGRVPDRNSKNLFDELSGFIVAGFDTTAATLSWGFKYLTTHQDVQNKIREELRNTFPESYKTGSQPSAEEFSKSKLPYLDAFSEEVLRHCCVVPANIRETMQDSVVLGHVVPKGADLYMLVSRIGSGHKHTQSSDTDFSA